MLIGMAVPVAIKTKIGDYSDAAMKVNCLHGVYHLQDSILVFCNAQYN